MADKTQDWVLRYRTTPTLNWKEFGNRYLSDLAIYNGLKFTWNKANNKLNKIFSSPFWTEGPSKPIKKQAPTPSANERAASNAPKLLTPDEIEAIKQERRKGVEQLPDTPQQIAEKEAKQWISENNVPETAKPFPGSDLDTRIKIAYYKPTPKPTFMDWLKTNAANYTSVAKRRELANQLGLKNYNPADANSNIALWNLMKKYTSNGKFILPATEEEIKNAPYEQLNPTLALQKQGGQLNYKKFFK